MKKVIKKIKDKAIQIATMTSLAVYSAPIYATNIESVPILNGTKKLLEDAMSWLLVLIPLATGLFLGIHAFKKTISDDQSVIAECNRKMKTTLMSGVIALSATAIVSFLFNYFK